VYLVWLAAQRPPAELIETLVRADVPRLTLQTAAVAIGATVWALLLAVPTAWLVARSDVPGGAMFRWLAPLPLAIPPYVGALVYAALLAPGGVAHQALAASRGAPAMLVPFPDVLYSAWGAAFVLGVFTSPHLFLAVYAALQRTSRSFEEAAASLGQSPREVLVRVTLPLLRPSLVAASLLVFVYAWVDFGVVSLLRVRTFTTAVYNALLAGFSLPTSAALSLVLVAGVGVLLLLQHRALGAARYTQTGSRSQQPSRTRLGPWRWAALAYLSLVIALALVVPLGALGWQAAQLGGERLVAFVAEQGGYLAHSLLVAVGGATATLGVALLFAWLHWNGGRGAFGRLLLHTGYAVPGTVLGLALVGLTVRFLPAVYGTPLVLVLAYLSLFTAPAVQSASAALSQVPTSLAEAARALGRGALVAFARVVAPLALPGLLGAWLLVFGLAMRELAATIVLRPPGFDTLAVRIWVHTMDVGPDPRAAVAALMLTVVTGGTWLVLLALQGRDVRAAEQLG
jgi:iron(III) transport system permease protein